MLGQQRQKHTQRSTGKQFSDYFPFQRYSTYRKMLAFWRLHTLSGISLALWSRVTMESKGSAVLKSPQNLKPSVFTQNSMASPASLRNALSRYLNPDLEGPALGFSLLSHSHSLSVAYKDVRACFGWSDLVVRAQSSVEVMVSSYIKSQNSYKGSNSSQYPESGQRSRA